MRPFFIMQDWCAKKVKIFSPFQEQCFAQPRSYIYCTKSQISLLHVRDIRYKVLLYV